MPNRALTHLAVGALAVLPVCGLAGPALADERAPLARHEVGHAVMNAYRLRGPIGVFACTTRPLAGPR